MLGWLLNIHICLSLCINFVSWFCTQVGNLCGLLLWVPSVMSRVRLRRFLFFSFQCLRFWCQGMKGSPKPLGIIWSVGTPRRGRKGALASFSTTGSTGSTSLLMLTLSAEGQRGDPSCLATNWKCCRQKEIISSRGLESDFVLCRYTSTFVGSFGGYSLY